jgi:hypothetical protein
MDDEHSRNTVRMTRRDDACWCHEGGRAQVVRPGVEERRESGRCDGRLPYDELVNA